MITPRQVKDKASEVVDHVLYQAQRNESLECEFFCAYEIIDLVELMSIGPDWHKHVANQVLESTDWPLGTKKIVKRYFNLAY